MALNSQELGQLMAFMQRTPLEGKESTTHAVLLQRLQQEAQMAVQAEQAAEAAGAQPAPVPPVPVSAAGE